MTGSVLDGLQGVGPARKRALLQHFGSPERFLAATREELEAVPGVPGKVGREIHEQLNRTETERGGMASRQVTLVVITGHSGAGKSEAIAAFEDGGYFCVDNLPPRMIGSLGELFRHEGSGVERAAVVSDVRGGEYFDDLIQVLDELEARRAAAEGPLPRGRRGDPARPLQGDPPPPPAGARKGGSSRGSGPSASCWRRCASAPTW